MQRQGAGAGPEQAHAANVVAVLQNIMRGAAGQGAGGGANAININLLLESLRTIRNQVNLFINLIEQAGY